MKIVSFAPLAGPGLEKLRSLGELELDPWDEHVPIQVHSGPDLSDRLDGVDVLLVEAGMTVGLIGCGAVGQATGERLAGLGARLIAFDPYADPDVLRGVGIELVELDELLDRSDVVSIHAAVTPETRGMLGADAFAR